MASEAGRRSPAAVLNRGPAAGPAWKEGGSCGKKINDYGTGMPYNGINAVAMLRLLTQFGFDFEGSFDPVDIAIIYSFFCLPLGNEIPKTPKLDFRKRSFRYGWPLGPVHEQKKEQLFFVQKSCSTGQIFGYYSLFVQL